MNTFFEWLEPKQISGYGSFCPICDGPATGCCRCSRADTFCDNGHSWHECRVHKKLVLGNSHGTSSECTCNATSPSKTSR